MSPNDAWKETSDICKGTVKRVLGTKEAYQKPSTSKEVQKLSSKQKNLRDEAESNQDKPRRQQLKKERNKVLNRLKSQLKLEKHF